MASSPISAPSNAPATLKKRAEFLSAKKGRKLHTPLVTIQMIANETGAMRVGYTVSKHCGNAVIRNKIKRRLRHLVRELWPEHGKAGYDYVLIARAGADTAPFAELRAALSTAMKRHP